MNDISDKYANFSHDELVAEINRLKKHKKYGLVWEHKTEKVIEDFETQQPYLEEVTDKRIEDAPGEQTNLIIEGDNFEALSILNYTHAGKVDVIYIDPPYNTGNKDFIYNDNYVDAEDEFRHSKWLSFMESRLKLAKNLLKDGGIIFISIDEHEQAALKMVCDECFGESNKLGTISVVNNLKGRSDDKFFATAHEFLLAYSNNSRKSMIMGLPMSDDSRKEYKYKDDISKYKEVSLQKTGKNSRRIDRPNMYYPVYYNSLKHAFSLERRTSNDIEILPTKINGHEGCWRWGKETFNDKKDTELVAKKINTTWRIYVKMRDTVEGLPRTIRPKTIFIDPKYDTGSGGRSLKDICGPECPFQSPKPVEYLKDIIRISGNDSLIILDFFAGSGTTGQAVLELNKEDGGHRQFILCTNNGDKGSDSVKIAEDITYPRVKTVITGKRQDGSKYSDGIPANLRYYKINHRKKKPSIDANRQDIVAYMENIIQVKENAYKQLEINEDFAIYESDEKYVGLVFEPFSIEEVIANLKEQNAEKRPVKLYVFSYSRDAFEDDYGADFEIEFVAMPEGLLKTYAHIVEEQKKEDL